MKHKSLGGYLLFWAFFTLGMSLLQLWLGLTFHFVNGGSAVMSSLQQGALFFFANAVAMQVVRDSWTDNRLMNSGQWPYTVRDFWLQAAVPQIVMVLGALGYWHVLLSREPSDGATTLSVLLATAALAQSGYYHVCKYPRISALV